MLHTYSIKVRDRDNWQDAFTAACAACEAVFDNGAGTLFVLADDEKLEALAALRKLAHSFRPDDSLADDFIIVHDGHGNSCLARKYAPYKSEPREPEDWVEFSLDELKELRRELADTEFSGLELPDAALRAEQQEIARAITDAEAGLRIFVAEDEDGHYFAKA